MVKPYVIGIAGPIGAGKSTLCESFTTHRNVTFINMDNFYKDIHDVPMYKGVRNFGSPRSINFTLLKQVLIELRSGNETNVPV